MTVGQRDAVFRLARLWEMLGQRALGSLLRTLATRLYAAERFASVDS